MKKRGMVSAFIIVGLFILILVVLLLSLYKGLIPTPSFLSKETDAITTYTMNCMEGIARNGIDIMSVQGGYIELPQYMLIERDSYIEHGFKVPYWYYEGRSRMPSILEMEKMLSEYVTENLPDCLNEYKDFPEYEIIPQSELNSVSKIGENKISVKTDYVLKVRHPGAVEYLYLEDFDMEFNSRFGRIYKLAKELMDFENKDYFLENYTDEMIACSDWLPYEGMELTCSPRVWRVSEMKEYTQTMIMHNLHFLQFVNTDFRETGMPYYDKQYKVPFTNENFKDFKVDVIYNPNWGMDFEVLPSHNGITEPYDFTLSKILMSCVKIYHHKYNVEYPVIFQLTDIEEPDNKFFFASPVIMERGLPNRYNEVLPWPTDYDETSSIDYCSDTTSISVYSLDSNGQMFSTPAIRSNRQNSLRVFVKDALTGTVLPYVNISYHCVMFRCSMGVTDYPREGIFLTGASPVLHTNFPDCIGGIVIAEKDGYHIARKQATVNNEMDETQVIVEMYPLKQIDYRIQVVEDHNGIIRKRDLEPGEYAMITIKNDEQMFEENIIYPSDSEYYSNLSLIVGNFKYELDVKLVTDDYYLGGLELNWTPQAYELMNSRYIIFYAVRLDPLIAPETPEDFQQLVDYAIENSEKYPPIIR